MSSTLESITIEVTNVTTEYYKFISNKSYHLSPMSITKLLGLIQRVKISLDELFLLSKNTQEKNAWLILNCCKLIFDLGQPLIWLNCGKYVTETFVYSALCLESVINLSTTRHLQFRMKLYSSAFASLLTSGVLDAAKSLLHHISASCKALRDREEVDLPLPDNIQTSLLQAEIDVAVMKCVLSFWKDLDFEIQDEAHFYGGPKIQTIGAEQLPVNFADRCLSECARIQQLTAGNTNEPWKRRSTSLLKGFTKFIESLQPTAAVAITQPPAQQTPQQQQLQQQQLLQQQQMQLQQQQQLKKLFSLKCLIDISTIAMFDIVENINIPEFVRRIWTMANQLDVSTESETTISELKLLQSLEKFITSSTNEAMLAITKDLVLQIETILHSDMVYTRRSLLRRVVIGIWSKGMYPILQESLSSNLATSLLNIRAILPSLLAVNRTLDLTDFEDGVFFGCLSLVTTHLLHKNDDYRGAISFAKHAIDVLENHRASRVDLSVHLPQEMSDLIALQHASFSTYSDVQDWFIASKRLGARAFAGFGIFGSSSVADRMDQAMAELHTDLLVIYFRIELQYGIQQKLLKLNHLKKQKDSKTKSKSGSTLTLTTDLSGTTVHRTSSLNTMLDGSSISSQDISIDKLPCVTTLKTYCAKSGYARCLLYLEMTRLETNHEQKLSFLTIASEAIEEAETNENRIKSDFSRYLVAVEEAYPVRPPIVLARSHRFIYLTPIASSKLHQAKYYRVFGKDDYNGSDVSVMNDALKGCERRIPLASLTHPVESAISVTQLRRGEKYIFATAAFDDKNEVLGAISATTFPVEAVNPLPTILLWCYFNQTAFDLDELPLAKKAAKRVCDRYFLKIIHPEETCYGKGSNVFLTEEPMLCMLAIQQSSPVLQSYFVKAFLVLETPSLYDASADETSLHWNMKRKAEIDTIRRLRRVAAVTSVACQLNSFELIVKCVSLGYELAAYLLRYDELQLAEYLQNPLTVYSSALQTIPSKFWRDLEHTLYCRLIHHVTRCAILNRNTAPASLLLTTFASDLPKEPPIVPLLNTEIQSLYAAISPSLRLYGGLLMSTALEAQIHTLLGIPQEQKTKLGVWGLYAAQRSHWLRGLAGGLAGVPGQPALNPQLEIWLREEPKETSALLLVLVQLSRELILNGNKSYVHKLVLSLPVYEEWVTPPVRQVCLDWGLDYVHKMPIKEEKPVKGGKEDKSPKVPVATTPLPDSTATKPPPVFTKEENDAQLLGIASLTVLLATSTYKLSMKRNNFPASNIGPLFVFDPYSSNTQTIKTTADPKLTRFDSTQKPPVHDATPAPATTAVASSNNANASIISATLARSPFHPNLSASDYLRYLLASLSMFMQLDRPHTAASVANILWTFIIDEWFSARGFAEQFKDSKANLVIGISALISLFEKICGIDTTGVTNVGDSILDKENGGKSDGIVTKRFECSTYDIKSFLYLTKELLPFIIQVLWLLEQWKDVVDLGYRTLNLFILRVPEFSKRVGDVCIPLIISAEEQIIRDAESLREKRHHEVTLFVSNWEEAQQKLRKKKMRIARLEKSEDELKFDSDKAYLQDKVYRAEATLSLCNQKLSELQRQKKQFDNLWTTGVLMLTKVRQNMKELVDACAGMIADSQSKSKVPGTHRDELLGDFSDCLSSEWVAEKLEEVSEQFDGTCHFLREKRDRDTLIEALKDQGDLMLLFGQVDRARLVWLDAVDGVFNVLDACNTWQVVVADALRAQEGSVVRGAIPSVVFLGKLSRYCAAKDWDMKARHCRMAAEICRLPFLESVAHPATPAGFAAYVCRELGGVSPFALGHEKLAANGLAVALNEIIYVLLANKELIAALPVVVLQEYFHASYTRKTEEWLRARLFRIRILVEARKLAEAVSMIASIRTTITAIEDRVYSTTLKTIITSDNRYNNIGEFDTRENGLDFYQLAPFCNHLPPHDDKNKEAIEWIKAYPKRFREFSSKFTTPAAVQSSNVDAGGSTPSLATKGAPVDPKKVVKEKEKLPVTKSNKGDKDDKLSEEALGSLGGDPLFPPHLEMEVAEVCALFLIKVAEIDTRVMTSYRPYLAATALAGDELALSNSLPSAAETSTDAKLTELIQSVYFRSQLLHVRYLLTERDFKGCNAYLSVLIEKLQNITQPLSNDATAELTQVWLEVRATGIEIADTFAKYREVVSLSGLAMKETSFSCSGYWFRKFLFYRAKAHFKLGNASESMSDLDTLIASYETAGCVCHDMIRAMLLKATLLRENVLHSSVEVYVAALQAAAVILRRARDLAKDLCSSVGFLGCDVNSTYQRGETALMKHVVQPPVLYSMTTYRDNYPVLSLPPTVNHGRNGNGETAAATATASLTYTVKDERLYRLGPVDKEGVYTESEFATIYLLEVRLYANCCSALASVLDDLRYSKSTGDSTTVDREAEAEAVLLEQSSVSETGLQLLRHIVYAPAYVRLSLLLSAGKTRVLLFSKDKLTPDQTLAPLLTALEISVQSAHPWSILQSISVELLECYGSNKLLINDKDGSRLKLALSYLLLSIKFKNQFVLLMRDTVELLTDKSLTSPCVEELAVITANLSSRANPIGNTHASGVNLGKAAPPPGNEGGAGPLPCGRDALFLLSSLTRGGDALWRDGVEYDLQYDLHLALRKTSTAYATHCCVSASTLPSSKTPPSIVQGGIYTFWNLEPRTTTTSESVPSTGTGNKLKSLKDTPTTGDNGATLVPEQHGIFDMVSGYFLIGAPVPGNSEDAKAPKQLKSKSSSRAVLTTTVEPVLVKVNLTRKIVVELQYELIRLRNDFRVATAAQASPELMNAVAKTVCDLLPRIYKTIKYKKEDEEEIAVQGDDENDLARKLTTELLLENGVYTIKCMLLPKQTSFYVGMNEQLLDHFIDIFSTSKCADGTVNSPLCVFFRHIWGY